MELVAVTTVNDVGLASIIRGVLEQAGIEATLMSGGEDVLPADALSPYSVLVAEDDADRARDVLAQYETTPEEAEEDEE